MLVAVAPVSGVALALIPGLMKLMAMEVVLALVERLVLKVLASGVHF